jgi:hypothetical protein
VQGMRGFRLPKCCQPRAMDKAG